MERIRLVFPPIRLRPSRLLTEVVVREIYSDWGLVDSNFCSSSVSSSCPHPFLVHRHLNHSSASSSYVYPYPSLVLSLFVLVFSLYGHGADVLLQSRWSRLKLMVSGGVWTSCEILSLGQVI